MAMIGTALLATGVFGFIALIGFAGVCGIVTGLSDDSEPGDLTAGLACVVSAFIFAGLAAKAFGL
jgi:hypothetical protein